MSEQSPVPAYSSETGKSYESWDALVAAESHGFIVTAILTRGNETWPWSSGLYPTKREATNARVRMRRAFRKGMEDMIFAEHVTQMRTFVRPLWKDPR